MAALRALNGCCGARNELFVEPFSERRPEGTLRIGVPLLRGAILSRSLWSVTQHVLKIAVEGYAFVAILRTRDRYDHQQPLKIAEGKGQPLKIAEGGGDPAREP